MTPERAAILATDCQAFEVRLRSGEGSNPPWIAYRVGHFAVISVPHGTHTVGTDGGMHRAAAFAVAHIVSRLALFDVDDRALAWRYADEISLACGTVLDDEPTAAAVIMQRVPGVIDWLRNAYDRSDAGDLTFVPYREWCARQRVAA